MSRLLHFASAPFAMTKNMDILKPKHKILKWILIIFGIIVLLYAIYFVYQVLSIRQQILSGNYNWEQYGQETSGKGGANVSSRAYNVATLDDPAVGSVKPEVTIVEFGDFQCEHTLKAFPIIRTLALQYPDKIKFIYRDFPLDDIHPWAKLAAQAGYCAQAQNRFWPLHDKIFQNQNQLSQEPAKSRELIINLAAQAGVNRAQFLQCLDSDEAKKEVEQDQRDGLAAGVSGTPTWFINGYRVAGVIPEDIFKQVIEGLLKK